MKRRSIPEYIQKKIYEGDKEALRAMGRKGGKVTAKRHAIKKYVVKIKMVEKKRQCEEMAKEANEHIVPIDDSSPSFIPSYSD